MGDYAGLPAATGMCIVLADRHSPWYQLGALAQQFEGLLAGLANDLMGVIRAVRFVA